MATSPTTGVATAINVAMAGLTPLANDAETGAPRDGRPLASDGLLGTFTICRTDI